YVPAEPRERASIYQFCYSDRSPSGSPNSITVRYLVFRIGLRYNSNHPDGNFTSQREGLTMKRNLIVSAALLFVWTINCFGQALSGTVVGTVTDQAGAVVPGA